MGARTIATEVGAKMTYAFQSAKYALYKAEGGEYWCKGECDSAATALEAIRAARESGYILACASLEEGFVSERRLRELEKEEAATGRDEEF
jgi:hypothetical protein